MAENMAKDVIRCVSQAVVTTLQTLAKQEVSGVVDRHSPEGMAFLKPLKGKGWVVPSCIPATTRNKGITNPTEQWKRNKKSRGRWPILPLEKEIYFTKVDFCSWLLRITYKTQTGFFGSGQCRQASRRTCSLRCHYFQL